MHPTSRRAVTCLWGTTFVRGVKHGDCVHLPKVEERPLLQVMLPSAKILILRIVVDHGFLSQETHWRDFASIKWLPSSFSKAATSTGAGPAPPLTVLIIAEPSPLRLNRPLLTDSDPGTLGRVTLSAGGAASF